MLIRRLLLTAGLCLAAGACRSGLSIAYHQTEFQDLSEEGVTVVATFRLHNAGWRPVEVAGGDYWFSVGSTEVMKGRTAEVLRVLPGDETLWRLPLRVVFAEVTSRVPEAPRGRLVPYRVTVQPRVTIGGWTVREEPPSAECRGLLPLVSRPRVHVAEIRVLARDEREATVQVFLTVSNPNAFAVTVTRLDYEVELAGYRLLEKRWEGPQMVRAQERFQVEGTQRVPIFAPEAGLAGWLQKPQGSVRLEGAGRLALGLGELDWPIGWSGPVRIVASPP